MECLGEDCSKQRQHPGAKALWRAWAACSGPHGLPELTPSQTIVQDTLAGAAFRGLGNNVEREWDSEDTEVLKLLSFHVLTKIQVLSLNFPHLENGDNSHDFPRLVLIEALAIKHLAWCPAYQGYSVM